MTRHRSKLVLITLAVSMMIALGLGCDKTHESLKDREPESETIAATVNGEIIYRKEIEEKVAYKEYAYEQNREYMEERRDEYSEEFFDEMMQEFQDAREKNTEEDVLDAMIRGQIILQEAEKLGLTADYELAYNEQLKVHESIYDESNLDYNNPDNCYARENYERLIAMSGLTLEEYHNEAGTSRQNMMTAQAYFEYVIDQFYDDEDITVTPRDYFEAYLVDLRDEYEIVIYENPNAEADH